MVQEILSRSCIWQAHCYPVRSCPRRVCPAGRGYTSDGQLYARRITRESGHQRDLMTLDRKTGRWIFKRQLPEAPGILLGAEGKDLVFAANVTGPYRVIWISAE